MKKNNYQLSAGSAQPVNLERPTNILFQQVREFNVLGSDQFK